MQCEMSLILVKFPLWAPCPDAGHAIGLLNAILATRQPKKIFFKRNVRQHFLSPSLPPKVKKKLRAFAE